MKRTGIIATLIAAFALMSLAFVVGCSGGASDADKKAAEENFVGSWDIVELKSGGQDLTSMLSLIKEYGGDVGVDINKDGTLNIRLAFNDTDESMTGKWEAKSADAITIKLDKGGSSDVVLKDGKITIDEGDNILVCAKS